MGNDILIILLKQCMKQVAESDIEQSQYLAYEAVCLKTIKALEALDKEVAAGA